MPSNKYQKPLLHRRIVTLLTIIHTGFTNGQLTGIILSFTVGILSVFLFLKGKIRISIFFLFLSGLILRLVVANLDPFLNTWDEQFHALVARNMMSNPLKPTLIHTPVLDYDFREWSSNYIWLHKQPWFLWQICLFFQLFGINEFVLRLPTVIMFSLLILIIYRTGKILINDHVGWFSAFIYTFSYWFVNFVSGGTFTDHNDSAFIFYVSLSIWAFLEYQKSNNRKWVYWIGIFAGIAILNKWLVGLLVYSGWFVTFLVDSDKNRRKREFKNICISLLLTIAVALPWQLFTLIFYTKESLYVFGYYAKHYNEVLGGHEGSIWYYITQMPMQFGRYAYYLVLPGLFFLVWKIPERKIKFVIVTYLLVTYLFYSLAKTKMPMFCDIVCPIIFLTFGTLLNIGFVIYKKIVWKKISLFIFAVFLCYLAIDNLYMYHLDIWHSDKYIYWKTLRTAALVDKYVAKKVHSEDCVLFNGGGFNTHMLMFYSGKVAYNGYPSEKDYHSIRDKKFKIAVFADKNLPKYLKDDPAVEKIYLQCVSY